LLTPFSAVNPYVEIKRQANSAAVFHSINGSVLLIISFVIPTLVLKHSSEGWIWAINRPAFWGLGRKKLRNAMASDLPQSIFLIQVAI